MPTKTDIINNNSENKSFLNRISSSKRLTLTYIVLVIWVALAIFGILIGTDLYALSVYFASGLPLIIGYLWAETSRPASLKDAASIVGNITKPNNYGNNGGYRVDNYNEYDENYDTNNNQLEKNISIYSDDSTVELKIDENQLDILINIGYIDSINNKYTFRKKLLDQIKSLLNDNMEQPMI